MKNFFISALLVCVGATSYAQLVTVDSFTKVPLPEGTAVCQPTISPDGSFVVASDFAGTTLSKITIATGDTKAVAVNANSNSVVISDDGQNVMFRRSSVDKNHLRYQSLYNVNLTTGKETNLISASRNLAGYSFAGNTANAVENGRVRAKNLAGGAVQSDVIVSVDYGHLNVTVNGVTKTIDPQGRSSYLWPSLSPDKTKIVYYAAYLGCYVCNLDGSNPVRIGELRAAKWLGNNMVVGMKDADNGEFVTASSIIVADLNGTKQTLTEPSMIALYPTVSADGKHISFATEEGGLFVINLK